jgi:hypothetical protein
VLRWKEVFGRKSSEAAKSGSGISFDADDVEYIWPGTFLPQCEEEEE